MKNKIVNIKEIVETREQDNFRHFALFAILAGTNDKNFDEYLKIYHASPNGDMEVEFKIGGIDFDFLKVIDRVEEQMNIMIEKRAQELVKEKLGEKLNEVINKLRSIGNQVEEIDFTVKPKKNSKY